MDIEAGELSFVPRTEFQMSPYTNQLPSLMQGSDVPVDRSPSQPLHSTTSTTFAIPSLPHQGNIPYYSHDSHAQNDDFMLFGDIYTESSHGSPKNTSMSHDFLQFQYPGTVTSDNPPVDSSFIALEAQQDAVPSGFLMSHPYQGTAHIGTPTSMPPPAPPILSPPVAESESEALSSTRRSEKEWLSNRENIMKLYMDENCTLKYTMKTMKESYGFNAS